MFRRTLITCLTLIGSVITAQAQSPATVGAVCNAALSQGIRDNYFVLSEREMFESYQRRLCDAKFSSYQSFSESAGSLGLSVPIAEGIIGLSGDNASKGGRFQESYSKYCSATYFDSEYKQRFTSYSSQVSSVLATNWVRCHELHLDAWVKSNNLGTFLDVVPQDSFAEFTVILDNKKVQAGNVKINNISPQDNVTCSRAGQPVVPGKTEVNQNKFSLTCTKHPMKEVQFSVETNSGVSNVVRVPANASKFRELDDRNRELEAQITSLRQQLASSTTAINNSQNALRNALGAWGANTGGQAVVNGAKSGETSMLRCPEGSYMVGISVIDQDGGGMCVTCINGVRFECRAINR